MNMFRMIEFRVAQKMDPMKLNWFYDTWLKGEAGRSPPRADQTPRS